MKGTGRREDIRWKESGPRKGGRITLCVTMDMESDWAECMKLADVAEDVRGYLATRLPEIKAKYAKRAQQAG